MSQPFLVGVYMTDMARYKNAEATGLVISHWMRTGYALNFLGAWEQLYNPNFNVTEFGNINHAITHYPNPRT